MKKCGGDPIFGEDLPAAATRRRSCAGKGSSRSARSRRLPTGIRVASVPQTLLDMCRRETGQLTHRTEHQFAVGKLEGQRRGPVRVPTNARNGTSTGVR